jgi:peroxiredoxin Q/BCP
MVSLNLEEAGKMRKAWGVLGQLPLAMLACGLLASPALAQTTPAAAELKVGDQAPDFTLEATDGKTYSLSKDLKGRWVVLGWFPKAFTAG